MLNFFPRYHQCKILKFEFSMWPILFKTITHLLIFTTTTTNLVHHQLHQHHQHAPSLIIARVKKDHHHLQNQIVIMFQKIIIRRKRYLMQNYYQKVHVIPMKKNKIPSSIKKCFTSSSKNNTQKLMTNYAACQCF